MHKQRAKALWRFERTRFGA